LQGLHALFEFGGFFVTAKLAQSAGFARQVLHEIGAVGSKQFFGKRNQVRVTRN
jgi:hypothetical protein